MVFLAVVLVLVFNVLLFVAFLLVGDNKLGFAMMREERVRARLSAATSEADGWLLVLLLLVPLPAGRVDGYVRSPRSAPLTSLATALLMRRWSAAVAPSAKARNDAITL